MVFLTPLPEELKEHLDYQAALHTGVNRMTISLVDQPKMVDYVNLSDIHTHYCRLKGNCIHV